MTDLRSPTVLERAVSLGRTGATSADSVMWTLAASEVVVLVPADATPTPETLDPLVVNRDQSTFLAVFTHIDRVPAEFAAGRTPVTLPASLLLRGAAEVGVVVNPGSAEGFEVPAEGVAAFRAQLMPTDAAPADRYFVREHLQDGVLVPFALLRRRVEGGSVVDEVMRDVGKWDPDRTGSVDRAVRYPIDNDLEEISVEQARDVEEMVRVRAYRPLRSP